MSAFGPGPESSMPPAAATAVALKALIGSARRQLERDGAVEPDTWDAIDALTDAMIEQIPPHPDDRRRHGG